MIRKRIQLWKSWMRQTVTEPRSELDRWEAAVRYAYDLGKYGARTLRRDKAPQMAAALSFRTLFSLLPVFVVGTILVKAIGGFEQFSQRLADFFMSLGLDSFQVTPAGIVGEENAGQSLNEWLLSLIGQVEEINLAAITWVGVAVLIYSAISLMVTIENSFNTVTGAPEGRAWLRRLPVYWTVLTLGPTAIALTMYVNFVFNRFISDAGGWWMILFAAPVIWSFIITWLVIFAIYKLVPNTTVHYRPALIGAFVAALLIELGKETLGAYLENAVGISQLYGSLGLIPLFMFWVYLMWLVALFGLEVAATIQTLQGRRPDELEAKKQSTGLVDPASVVLMMEVISEHFGQSKPTTPRMLADELRMPESITIRILDHLSRDGILHKLDREDGAVTLACPPEQISAERLIEIGFELVDEVSMGRRSALLTRLREAQRHLARESTLASLLAVQNPPQPSDQAAGA